MKHIAIFCDGTWNELDAPFPTNVVRLAEAVDDAGDGGRPQIVWYGEGVGTGQPVLGGLNRILGGAFGAGLMDNVEDAYRFLVFNYRPGDEIHIFGFSRGAFTARTLAGLIRNAGILSRGAARRIPDAIKLYRSRDPGDHPDGERARRFRAEHAPAVHVGDGDLAWRRENTDLAERSIPLTIRYLGLWDTVGALGVPQHLPFANRFNRRHRFHDAEISSMVERARHALAIDERRRVFEASPWDEAKLDRLNDGAEGELARYRQAWFPGDHGSVGGGGDVTGLSDGALLWVLEGAEQAGLVFNRAKLGALAPDPLAPLSNVSDPKGLRLLDRVQKKARLGPDRIDRVSEPARARWRAAPALLPDKRAYRPKTLARVARALHAARPGAPD